MDRFAIYLQHLFKDNLLSIDENKTTLFDEFCNQPNIQTDIIKIFDLQSMLMKNWELFKRISDIEQQSFSLPNASVGKYYEYKLDLEKLGLQDFYEITFDGLDEIGLSFNLEKSIISGYPVSSGDIKLQMNFLLTDQKDPGQYHQKNIVLIINPDPKSLWKNLPSDRDLQFWKEDNAEVTDFFLDKHIVISSKRGRSHANVGSARDDHFAYHNYDNGWSIIAVADGAGSAKYSREGSKIACEFIVEYFKTQLNGAAFLAFDELINEYNTSENGEQSEKIDEFIYTTMGNGAFQTHKKLENEAIAFGIEIKDLHTTFIFSLIKKYEFGYVILSFSVGDCPIALLANDLKKVTLLNQLDVGDYGGGTRFITMPEIFDPVKLKMRFSFQVIEEFSYLMLMTDGIYDAKFGTESNLENISKWHTFISDLKGANPDQAIVNFAYDNQNVAKELSKWMDFWESGNHDDRTLAIIF